VFCEAELSLFVLKKSCSLSEKQLVNGSEEMKEFSCLTGTTNSSA
jgi:hypothetical protein